MTGMSIRKFSVLSKAYQTVIAKVDKYVPDGARPLWEHPAGPKTVFFWGPLFKWGLVIASLSDILNRPPEKISANQSTSVAITGFIWSRYSFVIIPKNWSLFSVNFFMGIMQSVQAIRAFQYQQEQKAIQSINQKAITK